MEEFEGLSFDELREEDIGTLTPIMKRAFDEDSRLHLGKESGGPEGYDDGSFLRRWGLHPASRAFKVSIDGRPIGAIILWINESGENSLGNLFVDSALQNRGIGTRIWRFVEASYPRTRIWRTETAGFSTRNHFFYVNKCGFAIVGIGKPDASGFVRYCLEKTMPGGGAKR
jgi:hypothetical protein